MPKFSDLALSAKSAFQDVAQAEDDLEQARDKATERIVSVVAALKTTRRGKVALVDPDGNVSVYSLVEGDAGYKVETVAGDFDVPEPDEGEPTAPVPVEPGPDEPDLDARALIPDLDPDFLSNFAVS